MRIAYVLLYAAFAALGEALVARPALVWLRGQGLLHATLALDVPLGAWALLLAAFLAAFTLALSLRLAFGLKPRLPLHAAFLGLVALCLGMRALAGETRPPADPVPLLVDGLRATADALDHTYAGLYRADPLLLEAVLEPLPETGFRRQFRALRMHVRVLPGAAGAVLEALPGDEPGTIYVALAPDQKRVFLSALGLGGAIRQTITGTAGTHSVPGRDRLVPAYPGMRGLGHR